MSVLNLSPTNFIGCPRVTVFQTLLVNHHFNDFVSLNLSILVLLFCTSPITLQPP